MKSISIIIPCWNGEATIEKCLQAAFASRYGNFEVLVVDDCSDDDSVDIIKNFPCKLLQLKQHSGAAKARNIGAKNSSGELLFFTDADCLLEPDTLNTAATSLLSEKFGTVLGGTYSPVSYDKRFFSDFQSVLIHHFETKKPQNPDYIATHALLIDTTTFQKNEGFDEALLPILEDVEFSHRLRNNGCKLTIDPDIQVLHIFNFSIIDSWRNAFKKTRYWTQYSINNKDLFADSGVASRELKFNVLIWSTAVLLLLFALGTGIKALLTPVIPLLISSLWISRKLILKFYQTAGIQFTVLATAYYLLLYPLPIVAGAFNGIAQFKQQRKLLKTTH